MGHGLIDALNATVCFYCAGLPPHHARTCPTVSLGVTEAEVIEWMRTSERVRQRDIGVIAKWLAENYGDSKDNFVEAAKDLIKAQTEAGLGTFILDEHRQFVRDAIRRGIERRLGKSRQPLDPDDGVVWRYTSDADGERVLVRCQDGVWQASPVTHEDWQPEPEAGAWPGRYEIVSIGRGLADD
jgi:hypothetical protein